MCNDTSSSRIGDLFKEVQQTWSTTIKENSEFWEPLANSYHSKEKIAIESKRFFSEISLST